MNYFQYVAHYEHELKQIYHKIGKKDKGAYVSRTPMVGWPVTIETNIDINWTEMFALVIAGGRDYDDYETAEAYLDKLLLNKTDILILSGACDVAGKLTFTRDDGTKVYGADGIGERYAKERGYQVEHYPANWKRFGKKASYIRNKAMAERGKALAAFWDGKSTGTKMMIDLAEEYGLVIRKKLYI
jgi:hypothetical protein